MTTGAGGRPRSSPLRTLRLALWAVCLASACHHPTGAQRPPLLDRQRSAEHLAPTIDGLLALPQLSRGTWGISVTSLDRGDTLYRHNADALLTPASTLKIVTLAVAAERLGWDYRYTTVLYGIGDIANGSLNGHLLIVGSGDPSVDDWDGRASADFARWATALKAAGISRVTGHVVGDDDAFDDDGLGNGWPWDDVAASYSAPVSGLQFNENSAQIVITPGAIGASPTIESKPSSARLTIRNRATTAVGGTPLRLRPEPRSTIINVVGSVEPAQAPVTRTVSVVNPTVYFANAARDALIANGIAIDDVAVDADDLPTIDRTQAVKLADITSAPLSTIATTMMQLSQNLFAESLLKTLGRESSTREGTTATGRDVVSEQLAAWGIEAQDVLMVDGSGLSRNNLVTPAAQTTLLGRVYADARLRGPLLAALPVAGGQGTLERRMLGTAAAGNARAKTGSLSNARGLAGYVRSADGEMLAFSILANNYNVSATLIDRTTDAIVEALANFRR